MTDAQDRFNLYSKLLPHRENFFFISLWPFWDSQLATCGNFWNHLPIFYHVWPLLVGVFSVCTPGIILTIRRHKKLPFMNIFAIFSNLLAIFGWTTVLMDHSCQLLLKWDVYRWKSVLWWHHTELNNIPDWQILSVYLLQIFLKFVIWLGWLQHSVSILRCSTLFYVVICITGWEKT